MPDIFISYSTQHTELTRSLAAAIEAHYGAGSVWWDQIGLRAGDRFTEITRALDAAKAVIVVWTRGSVASDWVYAEATRAAHRGALVPVRDKDLDANTIPLPFNIYHTCDVDDTHAVLDAIEKRKSGEAPRRSAEPPPEGFRGYLLDPKQEKLPRWAGATRPASLLLAKHQLVPFDDFHGIRDTFVRWATEAPAHAMGRTALGRLVHAPAGLGKTRALIEIADALTREHGWLAGFVPRDVRGAGREASEAALERLILGGRDAAGLMLIVDDAESRQDDVVWLANRLEWRRYETTAKPSRLVLLSRGSGWWRDLVLKTQSLQDLCSLSDDAYDEITIPETIKVRDRRALFEASVAAFEPYHGASVEPRQPRPPSGELIHALETEDDYDRPFAVQIAALLHVRGVDAAEGRSGMADLLDKILGLEYAHWDNALKIADKPSWQAAMKNGVALTTLVGGVGSPQEAEDLIGRDPLYGSARTIDVPSVRYALASQFPSENDGVSGLEPDFIGEHHVLGVITNNALVDACLAWAGDVRERRQHILTVLNHGTRPEHGTKASRAEAQLSRLVQTRGAALGGDLITAAVATPGRLLDLCRNLEGQVASLDEPALAAIADALPMRSLKLMELSLRVAERQVQLARRLAAAVDAGSDSLEEQRAAILAAPVGTLGNRLSALGRGEEALAATKEAVDHYRCLAHTRPDAFLRDFATSLTSLGVMLANLGRLEEALARTKEAVRMYRGLGPDAFLPDLARSLTNLGIWLSILGRDEEALARSQEAVEICWELVRTRPDAFLPNLAQSLTYLGDNLSKLGRGEEARARIQEAVDLYQRLVQARPDAFLPKLALSLNNLGTILSNLGRDEEALAASQDAVKHYQALVRTRPDTFRSALAESLKNLGIMLSKLGRGEEALVASREAVDIIRSSSE